MEESTSKRKVFCGLDPGAKGSFCLLDPLSKKTAFCATTDPVKIMIWFQRILRDYDPQMICIEKVHAIQGTSAGSNFKFGYNVGAVNALCETTRIGIDLVQPKAWQKFIGVTRKGKAIKKEVAEIMHKLYPGAKLYGPRGGLIDGASDALAIAYYCSQKHK